MVALVSVALKQLQRYPPTHPPLDGMLVYCRVTPKAPKLLLLLLIIIIIIIIILFLFFFGGGGGGGGVTSQ